MEYIDLKTAIDLHDWCKDYPSPITKWWVRNKNKWILMSKDDSGFNSLPNKYPAVNLTQYKKLKHGTN